MLRASLVAAIMLSSMLICCPAPAQGARLGGGTGGTNVPAKPHFRGLAQELNLTAAQKEQFRAIVREEAQKLRALRAETGVTRQQKQFELRQVRREAQARIRGILTPEQVQKWLTLRDKMRGRHLIKR